MTILQNILAALNWDKRVTENFQSVSPAAMYGINPATTTGLVFGYLGGRGFGNTIADGTVTLTASSTNYVVANRSTGAVSAATSTTNWNDTSNYYRCYLIVTGTSGITTETDYREFTGGTSTGSGMANPMTTAGDIVYGGTPSGGVAPPTRLAASTNGYVLTLASGLPTWGAAVGFSNPMSASGDIIYGGTAGAATRLAKGSDTQVLTLSGGVPTWAAPASGGMTNPMTTVGDLIVGGVSGAAGRLGAGTATYVLTSNGAGAAPTWQAAAGGGFTGGTLTSALNEAPQVTLASNSTVNIGAAAANTIVISGTSNITAFDSIAAGAIRRLRFQAAAGLTHNATSLILPGSANITTVAGDVATMESLGSGNWRCIDYARSDGTALVTSGGALTGFTASLNTGSPNNTINASVMAASGGTTSQDIVLQPKTVTGALILGSPPDAAAAGGNKRGAGAIDLQQTRPAASFVASGAQSAILWGQGNQATGAQSMAGGSGTVVTGAAAVGMGLTCTADGDYSFAGGQRATARGIRGVRAHAGSYNSTSGDQQGRDGTFSIITSGATSKVLSADGSSQSGAGYRMNAPTGVVLAFRGLVAATGASDRAAWEFSGALQNVGGTVSLLGTPTVSQLGATGGATSWTVAVTANNTDKCIEVTVTAVGASGATNWVCHMRTAEAG